MPKTTIIVLSVVLILGSMTINQYSTNAATIDGIWFGYVNKINDTNYVTATVTVDSTNFMYVVMYSQKDNPYYCGAYWLQTSATSYKQTYLYGGCKGPQVDFVLENNNTASYQEWNDGKRGWAGLLTRRASLCL